jgi:hypothetical protein
MAQDAGNRYAGIEPATRADFDAVSPGREGPAVQFSTAPRRARDFALER